MQPARVVDYQLCMFEQRFLEFQSSDIERLLFRSRAPVDFGSKETKKTISMINRRGKDIVAGKISIRFDVD